MTKKSKLDGEYSKIIIGNPNKKFVLYLRYHLGNKREDTLKNDLIKIYGACKELRDQRLIIFIVKGDKVNGFINMLNCSETDMYLSFIQSEDELIKSE